MKKSHLISRLASSYLLSVLALLFAVPAAADTLLDNIDGISIDRKGKVTRFTAMVIDNDGRIAQLLKRRDRRPENIDFHEDGRGRTVMPGFIDSHVHMMDLGLAQLSIDLSGAHSLEDALSQLATYAKAHPDRPWIVGRGWDEERWSLGRLPTAADLDAAVDDRPVWLTRIDGHAGWANTAALAAAHVTEKTTDPAGGRIERITGTKNPAGVLVGAATALIDARVPPPRPQDRDLALHEAQELLAKNGVTAVADMGTSIDDWMTFRRAGDTGRLRIRIMAYAATLPEMLLIGGTGPTPWLYNDRLRLNGLSLALDGALGARAALLGKPYADDPASHGLSFLNGTQLRNLMSRATMSNFQVAIHAFGDAANNEALSAIEELSDDFDGDRRWRIEHAQVIDPADLAYFDRHGIIASVQPQHQTANRLTAEKRLGTDRLAGAYAWRSLDNAGAALAFGSDAPVAAPDPFSGIAAAISREDAAGQPFGGWQPKERVSRETAFSAYTAGAAYAGFADGRFGQLQVGEHADFIIIDHDPFLANPDELRSFQILETWIGGRKVYQHGSDIGANSGTRASGAIGR